ncbi:uncharacterized protein LOC135203974 [Macrobrachium nipponense]|uniref:uncharacterized protein LOC135203974 n=1 Tax=Macrobrachium nipponense TaxID=159736 RepID=UPI0030C7FB63
MKLLVFICVLAATRAAKLEGHSSHGHNDGSTGVSLPILADVDVRSSPGQLYSTPSNQGFSGGSNSIVQSANAFSGQSFPTPHAHEVPAPSHQTFPEAPSQSYSQPSNQLGSGLSGPGSQIVPAAPSRSFSLTGSGGQAFPEPSVHAHSVSGSAGQSFTGLSGSSFQAQPAQPSQTYSEPSVHSGSAHAAGQSFNQFSGSSSLHSHSAPSGSAGQFLGGSGGSSLHSHSAPSGSAGQFLGGSGGSSLHSHSAPSGSVVSSRLVKEVPITLTLTFLDQPGKLLGGSGRFPHYTLTLAPSGSGWSQVPRGISGGSTHCTLTLHLSGPAGQFLGGDQEVPHYTLTLHLLDQLVSSSVDQEVPHYTLTLHLLDQLVSSSVDQEGPPFLTKLCSQLSLLRHTLNLQFIQRLAQLSNQACRHPVDLEVLRHSHSEASHQTSFGVNEGSFSGVSSQGPQVSSGYGAPGAGNCREGEVSHFDGSCVVPEVSRHVFVYQAPEREGRTYGPPPKIPLPKEEHNIVFIRTPEGGPAQDPIVIPPPQKKHIIYVLNKDAGQQQQKIIEITTPKPKSPEVYFVNYAEGENPTLPGGIDFETALNSAVHADGQVIGGGSSAGPIGTSIRNLPASHDSAGHQGTSFGGEGFVSGSADAAGSFGPSAASGSFGSGATAGSFGSSGATGSFGSGATAGSFGSGGAAGSFGSGSSAGSFGSAGVTGSFGSGAATGSFGSSGAIGSFDSGVATGSFGSGAATGSFGSGAATGSFGSGAATGSFGSGAATGSFASGATAGSFGSSAGVDFAANVNSFRGGSSSSGGLQLRVDDSHEAFDDDSVVLRSNANSRTNLQITPAAGVPLPSAQYGAP